MTSLVKHVHLVSLHDPGSLESFHLLSYYKFWPEIIILLQKHLVSRKTECHSPFSVC